MTPVVIFLLNHSVSSSKRKPGGVLYDSSLRAGYRLFVHTNAH